MKNLSKRLEDLETKIIETKNNKKRLKEKVEKREKEIHQKVIKIWNKEALNDKSFHSDLNKIVSSFKKIDPLSALTFSVAKSIIVQSICDKSLSAPIFLEISNKHFIFLISSFGNTFFLIFFIILTS